MSPLFNCRVLALSPEVVKKTGSRDNEKIHISPLTECLYFSKECKQAMEDTRLLSIEVLSVTIVYFLFSHYDNQKFLIEHRTLGSSFTFHYFFRHCCLHSLHIGRGNILWPPNSCLLTPFGLFISLASSLQPLWSPRGSKLELNSPWGRRLVSLIPPPPFLCAHIIPVV